MKRAGIHTLIFLQFFEPYAPKSACMVPKGSNFVLINRLHRERCLFLGQKLDFEITNTLLGLMVYLSREDKTWDQFLFINCTGGWVLCGIALFDMMRTVPPYVHTIGIGKAYSMGSLVLSGGEISERLAFPHGSVRANAFFLFERKKKTMPSPYGI